MVANMLYSGCKKTFRYSNVFFYNHLCRNSLFRNIIMKSGINNKKDKVRDAWLNSQGFHILRFWNNDIFDNLNGILEIIQRSLISPSPDPSHQGRGAYRGTHNP